MAVTHTEPADYTAKDLVRELLDAGQLEFNPDLFRQIVRRSDRSVGCRTGVHMHLNTTTRQLVIGPAENMDDTLLLGWVSVFRVGVTHGTGMVTKYSLHVNDAEVRRITVTSDGNFLTEKSFPKAQRSIARALVRGKLRYKRQPT